MKNALDILFKPSSPPDYTDTEKLYGKAYEQSDSRYWVNFDPHQPYPEYTELACMLLLYDELVIETDSFSILAKWSRKDPYIRELFKAKLIIPIFCIPTEKSISMRYLYEEDRELYDIIGETNFFDIRHYDLSYGEQEEINDFIRNVMDDSTQRNIVLTFKDYVRSAIHHNLVVRAPEWLLNAFQFDDILETHFETNNEQFSRAKTLANFGIPFPITPNPDELFEFRESNAHKKLIEFLSSVHKNIGPSALDFNIQHAIIETINHIFKRDAKKHSWRNVRDGIVGTAFDLLIASVGIPLPIGAISVSAKGALEGNSLHPDQTMTWRSFFIRWLKDRR